MTDIEKTFLTLEVEEKDWEVTKFLKVKDIKQPAKEDNWIAFPFQKENKNKKSIKIQILRQLAANYDSLGMITPLVLPAKIFFQKL